MPAATTDKSSEPVRIIKIYWWSGLSNSIFAGNNYQLCPRRANRRSSVGLRNVWAWKLSLFLSSGMISFKIVGRCCDNASSCRWKVFICSNRRPYWQEPCLFDLEQLLAHWASPRNGWSPGIINTQYTKLISCLFAQWLHNWKVCPVLTWGKYFTVIHIVNMIACQNYIIWFVLSIMSSDWKTASAVPLNHVFYQSTVGRNNI